MTGYTPFLIANPRVGMERDIEPWLLPEDAYPDLEDCYLWRGRIKKKMGYDLLGRLNLQIPVATVVYGPNSASFTILFSVSPITPGIVSFVMNGVTFMDNGTGGFFQTDGGGGSTINYVTGAVVLVTVAPLPPLTPVFYFPGLPVMGLKTLETINNFNTPALNSETLIGFDQIFAYRYQDASSSFINFSTYKTTGTLFKWTGNDSDFFWTTNYAQAFWATNFVPGFQDTPTSSLGTGDGIRWHDQNITAAGNGWVNFLPYVSGPNPPMAGVNYRLMGCLMLLPYKGTLIALNTWEGQNYGGRVNYAQRARWCKILASPFYDAQLPAGFQGGTVVESWMSDIPGNGGFIDAPTSENIVSAEFVKDTLIVYFEFSTWQLRFTGIKIQPFVWEKINTELGSVSTFSVVPFDKTTIAVGNVGIHACDSVNVARIDQKIPDEVFSIQNKNAGNERVYGIRDYYPQLVYWAVPYLGSEFNPDQTNVPTLRYPNKMLVYNYVDQSFSYFNDSFTCFGYFQSRNDVLWRTVSIPLAPTEPPLWSAANFLWVNPQSQSEFPSVVGGNQQGFVETLMEQVGNEDSLYITNAVPSATFVRITSPNHNLGEGDFIKITKCTGIMNFEADPAAIPPIDGIYKIINYVNANQFDVDVTPLTSRVPPLLPSGMFTGKGTMTVVSNINILTKRFNPWIQEGAQVRLGYVDFYFNRTDFGKVTVDLYINEDDSKPTNTEICATSPETTYQVSPDTVPYNEQKLWKRVYFEDVSQLFQINIFLDDSLMIQEKIRISDIQLHGMIPYFSKSGRIINV